MGTTRVRADGGGPPIPAAREAEFAARWSAGEWRGRILRTERGDSYTVIYQGRRGGGAGPDFRDAALARSDGVRVAGDVELHLRAGDWCAHGHDADRRYATVVLHVVFTPLPALAPPETPLPLGGATPIVVLSRDSSNPAPPAALGVWPCMRRDSRIEAGRLRTLLMAAGRERFAQCKSRFESELADAGARDTEQDVALIWSGRDRALFVAIAEALGYGRDRDALRLAGESLLAKDVVSGGSTHGGLDALARSRLRGLRELRCRWESGGPWSRLSASVQHGTPRAAAKALVTELRAGEGCVSAGRARIVAANVVLPFAAAAATLDCSTDLAQRALAVYEALPGLPSNAITRLMAHQLGMPRLPTGAAAQQGLHHIWALWCREKRCDSCPCARAAAPAPVVPARHAAAAKSDTLSLMTARRTALDHRCEYNSATPHPYNCRGQRDARPPRLVSAEDARGVQPLALHEGIT